MRIAVVTMSKSVHARLYVEFLANAGHDVTVITNRDEFSPGLDVRTVNTRPLKGRRFKLPDRVIDGLRDRKLHRALKAGDYDVVNVQMLLADGIVACLVSPAPVVVTLFGSDVYLRDRLPQAYLDLMPKALRRATTVHACSEHMAAELLSLGVPAERIETFQYGVEPDRFRPLVPASEREPVIVSARALRPLYRVHLLVEAMPAVLAENPAARLAIYDTGDEEPRLRELAASLGVADHVEFRGRVTPDELAAVLGRSAVWASMASSDGTPISMLEAMSAGAFPVVADLPTLHEWIESPHGLFVEPEPAAVAAGMIEALRLAPAGAHVEPNRRIIEERADRATNLRRFESLLESAAEKGRADR